MRCVKINGEDAYECEEHPNYFVTKAGRVYTSYVRGAQGKSNLAAIRELSYGTDRDGYKRVVLSNNGEKTHIKVHQLVARQFLGEMEDGKCVNHIDGNKQNNSYANLEYISPKENTQHAHVSGLCSRDTGVIVCDNGRERKFRAMAECRNDYPMLTRYYLDKFRRGEVNFHLCYFERASDKRISPVVCWYNGQVYRTFDSMQDCDEYFRVARGSTSAKIKSGSLFWMKQLNVSFPTVTTIESDD